MKPRKARIAASSPRFLYSLVESEFWSGCKQLVYMCSQDFDFNVILAHGHRVWYESILTNREASRP